MDAKQACDKLNGFNFQNRYLVGKFIKSNLCLNTLWCMKHSIVKIFIEEP